MFRPIRSMVFLTSLLLVGLCPALVWGQQAQLINGNRTHAGATNYGLTTGTATAYILTLNAAIPGYAEGACYLLKIHAANTGAATLNVNGRGVKPIVKFVAGAAVPLVAGDFGLGQEVTVCDDTGGTGGAMQARLGGGAGTGGVAISGTPASPQLAQWASPTAITGVTSITSTQLPSEALTNTNVREVENKLMVPRRTVLDASGGTITPNIDNFDHFRVDAIPGPLTIANPLATGSNPRPEQEFRLCLFSTAPRALTFGNQYSGLTGIPLPTTTTGTSEITDCYKFVRNPRVSRWELISSTQRTGTELGERNLPLTGIKMHATAPVGPTTSGVDTIIFFDGATTQCILWETTVPPDYLGSPAMRLWYTMAVDTNTTHTATFDVRVKAHKVGETLAAALFGTFNQCDDVNIPGTVGLRDVIVCALTNNDTMAPSETLVFELCANTARGTWTDKLGLLRARFEYAK